jgi:hypothetical protein
MLVKFSKIAFPRSIGFLFFNRITQYFRMFVLIKEIVLKASKYQL